MSFFGNWQQRFQPGSGQPWSAMGQGRPMGGLWAGPPRVDPAALQQRPQYPGGGFLNHAAQDMNTQTAAPTMQNAQPQSMFNSISGNVPYGATLPQTQFQPQMQYGAEHPMGRMPQTEPRGRLNPDGTPWDHTQSYQWHQQKQQMRRPTTSYFGTF